MQRFESRAHEGHVWFDLPLNGNWSDLTALLNFRTVDEALVLELDDIHVM